MRKTISNPILNLFFFLITISSFAQQATEESNAVLLKQVEENNKRLETLRTEDSLIKIGIQQSGDYKSAAGPSAGEQVIQDEYGAIASPNANPDPDKIVKGETSSDVESSLSKSIDTIPPVIIYVICGLFVILIIKFLFGK